MFTDLSRAKSAAHSQPPLHEKCMRCAEPARGALCLYQACARSSLYWIELRVRTVFSTNQGPPKVKGNILLSHLTSMHSQILRMPCERNAFPLELFSVWRVSCSKARLPSRQLKLYTLAEMRSTQSEPSPGSHGPSTTLSRHPHMTYPRTLARTVCDQLAVVPPGLPHGSTQPREMSKNSFSGTIFHSLSSKTVH
jgi:hypothetical protein